MNREMIEEIYNSYINGQKKQMLSGIKEYEETTGESFWDGLDEYIWDWNPILKYRILKEIISYYAKVGE